MSEKFRSTEARFVAPAMTIYTFTMKVFVSEYWSTELSRVVVSYPSEVIDPSRIFSIHVAEYIKAPLHISKPSSPVARCKLPASSDSRSMV